MMRGEKREVNGRVDYHCQEDKIRVPLYGFDNNWDDLDYEDL